MTPDNLVNLLCIFSLVHNSFLAEANTLAWALGTGSGVLLAGFVGSRLRPMRRRENPGLIKCDETTR